MPVLTPDNVLLWLHGRRVGLVGDGSFSASSGLMVDGQLVGSKRGPVVSQLATGANGVGNVSFPAAVDGDVVLLALDLTTPANVTSSFEAVISTAGQIHQTSAANLSIKNILFHDARSSQVIEIIDPSQDVRRIVREGVHMAFRASASPLSPAPVRG